ncbi:hypothetical protein PYCC9005_000487 [Savitreella phatthalungensis]
MRAWQAVRPGKSQDVLELKTDVPKVGTTLMDDEVLVKVISTSLNPVDPKTFGDGVTKFVRRFPIIPGCDFAGRLVKAGSKIDHLREGTLVWGRVDPLTRNGVLAEYVVAKGGNTVQIPEGVKPDSAATLGVAAGTALIALRDARVGQKIFVNGGSGGVGVFTLQIAKHKGLRVVASCSTANIDLCKSLGADEVLDYKAGGDILQQMKARGDLFDHFIDNVGNDMSLYKRSREFVRPEGSFVQVGLTPKVNDIANVVGNFVTPSFFGGGRASYRLIGTGDKLQVFYELSDLLKNGHIDPVIDSVYEFEQAKEAFAKLDSGRARGKIIVHVNPE